MRDAVQAILEEFAKRLKGAGLLEEITEPEDCEGIISDLLDDFQKRMTLPPPVGKGIGLTKVADAVQVQQFQHAGPPKPGGRSETGLLVEDLRSARVMRSVRGW